MKRDLVKLGYELREKVPFHTIVREFEIKGEKFRIRCGWYVTRDAVVEAHRGLGQDRDWVLENWSVVPRTQLQTLTTSIKAEAHALLQGMDDFIEKECEAEIKEMVTDVICKKGETKDRHEIFVDAINSRFVKMSDHFQKNFARPTTFNEFRIIRRFNVPKPATVSRDWDEHVNIVIDEDSVRLLRAHIHASSKAEDTEVAMLALMAMPQIAEFCLKVYMQFAHLAEWEKSQ